MTIDQIAKVCHETNRAYCELSVITLKNIGMKRRTGRRNRLLKGSILF